ncbi:MAG: pyrrolysine--tRNA(Pyl) ligase large subunit [Methermicoccaceae archaeon]
MKFTEAQRQRLVELGAPDSYIEMEFGSKEERGHRFDELVRSFVSESRNGLRALKDTSRRPYTCLLEDRLIDVLCSKGFVQVRSPTIMKRDFLERMGIDRKHPLTKQVFWLDDNTCLRPMLAPNLYQLWRRLRNVWNPPISLFEIGSCFRKESKGTSHTEEFTMMNIAELAPVKSAEKRLEEFIELVMGVVGSDYVVDWSEKSDVYGTTVDVLVNGIEVASGAYGPHPLDEQWGIIEPWAGIGFGIERLVAANDPGKNIKRFSRSLSYLDGWRLDIK